MSRTVAAAAIALFLGSVFHLTKASATIALEQNWDAKVKDEYAFTPQGSKIIPYDWALALWNGDDSKPFFSSENMARFGYITQKPSTLNPDGLPIGFMRDEKPAGETRVNSVLGRVASYEKKPQLGMNCAACHTSQLSYKSEKLTIYGGSSYSNFQLFVTEMDEAVARIATENGDGQANQKHFVKFAQETARRSNIALTKDYLNGLRKELGDFYGYRQKWENRNGAARAGLTYGPVRNDAFGVIFNQALADFTGIEANVRAPNAPVKYPMLWDSPYHEVVQWIGIARNSRDAGGPIARNIGQVLGVFGHSDIYSKTNTRGYCTSAKRKELNALEDWVRTLRSPTWPKETFGFDVAKAERGAKLYATNCATCHALNERSAEDAAIHLKALGIRTFAVSKAPTADPKRANEQMIPIAKVGTDPLTYENAANRTALTGPLEGRPVKVLGGRPLEAEEPGATVLRHVVAGSILGSFSWMTCENTSRSQQANIDLLKAFAAKALHFTPEDTEPANFAARMSAFKAALANYKARSLNGVWAAPPYLHNGSVRTLKQLLLPPSERETKFVFDCNEFDPVDVGINCAKTDASNRVGEAFEYDTTKPGNSNQGHEYGTGLKEEEKLELIEYIKAL